MIRTKRLRGPQKLYNQLRTPWHATEEAFCIKVGNQLAMIAHSRQVSPAQRNAAWRAMGQKSNKLICALRSCDLLDVSAVVAVLEKHII